MKKNKILVGVISIMFAGIIALGIIECNNSNTKDNNKLFIGNGHADEKLDCVMPDML